jgi:hypothetical protein
MARKLDFKACMASFFSSEGLLPILLLVMTSAVFYTPQLMASEIVYIGKSFVIIDAGSGRGLKIGSEVCFEPTDGMDSICGRVAIARNRLCGIKVRRAAISRLSLGLEGRSDDLVEAVSQKKMSKEELKNLVDEIEKKIPAPVEKLEKRQAVTEVDSNMRFSLAWIISPLRNYRYRLPSYSLENEVTGEGELWTAEAIPAFAPFTFEAELAWQTSDDSELSLGIRRQAIIADAVFASYSAIDSSEKLEGLIDASALGLRMDWQEKFVLAEDLSFFYRPGIDIEESKVEVTENLSNGEGQLAKLQSRLLLLSLRAGSDIVWRFLTIDWRIGMTLFLPVTSKATKAQVNMSVKSDASLEQAANADNALVTALDHKKTSLGVQLIFGAGKTF